MGLRLQTLVELLGLDFYPDPLSRCLPRPVVHGRDIVGGVLSRFLTRPVAHGRDMVGGVGCVGRGAAGEQAMPVMCPEGSPRGIDGCPEGAPEALTETRRVSSGVHQRQ